MVLNDGYCAKEFQAFVLNYVFICNLLLSVFSLVLDTYTYIYTYIYIGISVKLSFLSKKKEAFVLSAKIEEKALTLFFLVVKEQLSVKFFFLLCVFIL